uniref:Uncharacterized protein n=1 Tax=Ananas comosus var. bracteatus TaxID=296719 RepID=A0A6V7Q3B1_ANACO|nr:unnamed protein product [Ananas comosus var. bracteatus]
MVYRLKVRSLEFWQVLRVFTLGDRSLIGETGPPVNSAAQPARQPVPGSRDRSLLGRVRFRAGRDRSRTLVFRVRSERPVPAGERPVPLGENCPVRADANLKKGKEKKEKRRRRSLLGGLGAPSSSSFLAFGGLELAFGALWRIKLQPYLVLSLD